MAEEREIFIFKKIYVYFCLQIETGDVTFPSKINETQDSGIIPLQHLNRNYGAHIQTT